MLSKLLTVACLTGLLSAGAAFAQTAAPTPAPRTTTVPPATTAPVAPSQAATPAGAAPSPAAALPAGTKVNLNTATAAELDALPTVGKARTKVIMTERAKSPFKDWADFDARTQHTSVNAGVKAKIKDNVSF